ncbi:NADAR family protein [Roseovarius rhodophyticola]|uniref:NADAR family protein n=1 Tax=Roseovarius rhodophyticola TaxID=3080827 RepID=A0ABZ2TLS3_9RHOB|nr:NADAR family protein [Roseovarius sp. W115]MDV2928998.1 NADAR family protein [Roseovarius sp. W115]
MDEINEDVVFYWSGPFSQWQRSLFELDGKTFKTAEQAMMYLKAVLFGDLDIAQKILQADDPGTQKALGRQVRGFDEGVWEANRVEIVHRVNLAKFDQNKGLRRKLFQTLGKDLVEASPVDIIWGIGLAAEVARVTPRDLWPGQNLLGKVLTEVRDILETRYPDEAASVQKETLR